MTTTLRTTRPATAAPTRSAVRASTPAATYGLFLKALLASALLAAASLLLAPPAHAASTQGTPSQLVLDNSSRILKTLEARRDEFNADPAALRTFIASEFDQMFDRDYAARMVLGRHGRGASNADVKLFADALANSLMSRYGSSLLGFNTRLQVRITDETSMRGGAIVKVESVFERADGGTIPVAYLMHKRGGDWKVFDVIVEGVSFVNIFRKQFDQPLSRKSIAQVAADIQAGRLNADAGR